MTFAFWMVLFPTLFYGGAAVAYGIQRDWPYVVIFGGYLIANCGFLAIELLKKQ
jgi:hypothetical protein